MKTAEKTQKEALSTPEEKKKHCNQTVRGGRERKRSRKRKKKNGL